MTNPKEASDLLSSLVEQMVTARVDKVFAEKAGVTAEDTSVKTVKEKEQKGADRIYETLVSDGEDPVTGKRVSFQQLLDSLSNGIKEQNRTARDASTSPDLQLLLPRAVQRIMMDVIPFEEVLAPLLRKIRQKGMQTVIQYPLMGQMGGLDLDMAEGDEYPDGGLDFAGKGMAQVGKSGIAVSITEEMIRYNMFDYYGMLVRAATRALVRWKEKKCKDHIMNMGVTLLDNDDASYACTTGRDINGVANGSFIMNDLFTVYADMINSGFVPNAIIVHPMTWLIFAQNDKLRHLATIGAPGGAWYKSVQGEVGYLSKFAGGAALGASMGVGGTSPVAKTYVDLPGFVAPLRVIVSPFIPFTAASGATPAKTDMILCDTNELGVMFVDEDPVVESWSDPARDIEKTKMRERYAIGILNAGQAVRLIKNVRLVKGWDIEDKLSVNIGYDISGEIPPIPSVISK